MNLSKICIDPQLRNGWQAIDLGVLLALRWYGALLVSWVVPSLIVFVLLTVVLFQYNWIAALVVWWLKPLWDRMPLAVASRALFGEPLNVRSMLGECFTVFKRDCLLWLSWRRFNPTRSFDMPVTLLEGLRGATRSRRLTVLHQSASNAAMWLTAVCLSLEIVFVYSVVIIAMVMVPSELSVNWFELNFGENLSYVTLVLSVLSYCAMALVAPFYSASGFAIYISRRVELEGWDIEIRFRHLMDTLQRSEQRLAKKKNITETDSSTIKTAKLGTKLAILLAPCALLVFGASSSMRVEAQESTEPEFIQQYYDNMQQAPEVESAKQKITEVLSGEDFHRTRLDKGWRKIELEEEEDPEELGETIKFLESLGEMLAPVRRLFTGAASGFEMLVWLLIFGVVGYLIYRFRDLFGAMIGYAKSTSKLEEKPQVLFGMDVRKESLPDDVPQQVLKLWNEGKAREAIGLLYRATLSRLIYQFSFEFYDGYTEQECIRTVSAGSNSRVSEYVIQLTRVWQYVAYAHQSPEQQEVIQLCDHWPQLFDGEFDHKTTSHSNSPQRIPPQKNKAGVS